MCNVWLCWCINSFNSLKSISVQTVLVYCHLILKVFRRTLHEHSVTSSFRSLQGGQEIAGPALTWQSLIGRRVITARSWVKPKRLRTAGRGGWHSFSVYIFACFFNFGPKPIMPFSAEHFLLTVYEWKFCHKTMLLRILTFFKWVYGNPLTFLVGIRRIPAYHVDYTTDLYTLPKK